RIKEAHIHFLYKTLHQDMVKNTLTVYIVELIAKTMTEPETNIELFEFFEQSLLQIDSFTSSELVNMPLIFTMQLANHLGFGIQNEYTTQTPILDLVNGRFCTQQELQSLYFVQGHEAQWISNLVIHGEPGEHLSAKNRQELLMICIRYLKLHIPHMGELKSLQVLHDILH
ncbi:MAG: DNA repair protein RecO C-terminal domain-containing protein, partial [Chitinophagaceae bacterium]|nr:DNA repair protein RecO C-terminal domain-containing protein [Chitinophagaceae bacterium]